jgi:hypothetical protein
VFQPPEGTHTTQFLYAAGLCCLLAGARFKFEGNKAQRLVANVGRGGDRFLIPSGLSDVDDEDLEEVSVCERIEALLEPELQRGVHALWKRVSGGKDHGLVRWVNRCVGSSAARFAVTSENQQEGLREDKKKVRLGMQEMKRRDRAQKLEGESREEQEEEKETVKKMNDRVAHLLGWLEVYGKGVTFEDYMVRSTA